MRLSCLLQLTALCIFFISHAVFMVHNRLNCITTVVWHVERQGGLNTIFAASYSKVDDVDVECYLALATFGRGDTL